MQLAALLLACARGPDPAQDPDPIDTVEPPGDTTVADPPDPSFTPPPAAEDWGRDRLSAAITVDLATSTATAVIRLAASASEAASFEIGDLDIHAVTLGEVELDHLDRGTQLDVGVPASDEPVDLTFRYTLHPNRDGVGVDALGFTLIWPYACGRLYPCRSDPADGLRFQLTLTGVREGKVAVYPTEIAADAPPYMIAWAVADYDRLDLGTTPAGTRLSSWHIPALAEAATQGTAHLREAFTWLEEHIGPYRFGPEAGTVAVYWGEGALGGMEHHPFWHVATDAVHIEETQVHEAAHGWFGNGVRIACWEDLTLSEGTVTYLAARVLDEVAPEVGAATWEEYRRYLRDVPPDDPVLPSTCGEVHIMRDNLWNEAVYYRGAYFYRAVAGRIGVEALDAVLATFYRRHAGQAARMTDMLDLIRTETGYDPTACADLWLRSPALPRPGPCP